MPIKHVTQQFSVDSKFLVKRENPNRIFNSSSKHSQNLQSSRTFSQLYPELPPSGGRVACPGGPRSADSAPAPRRSAGSAHWRRAPRRHRSLRGSPKTCQSRCGRLSGAGGDFMALCEEMVQGMMLSNLNLSHGHETENLGFSWSLYDSMISLHCQCWNPVACPFRFATSFTKVHITYHSQTQNGHLSMEIQKSIVATSTDESRFSALA